MYFVLVQGSDGSIVHARNLDYNFAPVMQNFTAQVAWTRAGKLIFTSVGFFGMSGFNTVTRHGSWSLSQNERDQGPVSQNLVNLFVRQRITTFSRIRQLAEQEATFAGAVAAVASIPLDAPSYFVIAGVLFL